MSMTINPANRLPTMMPSEVMPATGLGATPVPVAVKAVQTVVDAAANLVDAYAQAKESQAKAREMLAQAEALEAKAELAQAKEELEDFIATLEEKIRLLEKLLAKEGDDVQAEEYLEENIASQVAASIEEMAEETEKLVAGFEPRREEILDEKRGIEV